MRKNRIPIMSDIGKRVNLFEDGKVFTSGKITDMYWGTFNKNPCIGVIIDDENGYLIDYCRRIEFLKEEKPITKGWKRRELYKASRMYLDWLYILSLHIKLTIAENEY